MPHDARLPAAPPLLSGLYTIFHQPETFERYLLVSPSIWWGNLISFEYEQSWAERHTDLRARGFLAAAERMEMPGLHWTPEVMSAEVCRTVRVITTLQEMVTRLAGRGYPSPTIESVVLAGEHHPTVIPVAVSCGLMSLLVPAGER